MKKNVTYKDSGVDVELGDRFVEKIKTLVPSTFDGRVKQGIGGFAAVYELSPDRLLAASTDGVGTKLKLAQELGEHRGVGIDLVAMCVNDLICVGARPMFFLDYMAFGKLNEKVSVELLEGMVDGCKQGQMALIGGETAEMPGLYEEHEYDLAGFSVGELSPEMQFSETNFSDGDILIGIASSGFHSNGYSLVRKVLDTLPANWEGKHYKNKIEFQKALLAPTRIYVSIFEKLRREFKSSILGVAHITGGGIENIPRLSEKFDYELSSWPSLKHVSPVFEEFFSCIEMPEIERLKTFNMGVGLVLLVKKDSAGPVMNFLHAHNEKVFQLGNIKKGSGQVRS